MKPRLPVSNPRWRCPAQTDDVYILDVGSELFVWVGRGSSVEEKKSGFPYAARFIEETGRNVAMPVSRLSQGYETLNFKG